MNFNSNKISDYSNKVDKYKIKFGAARNTNPAGRMFEETFEGYSEEHIKQQIHNRHGHDIKIHAIEEISIWEYLLNL